MSAAGLPSQLRYENNIPSRAGTSGRQEHSSKSQVTNGNVDFIPQRTSQHLSDAEVNLEESDIDNRTSFFPHAHHFSIHGGYFYSFNGNSTIVTKTNDLDSIATIPGIVQGSRVLSNNDVSLGQEIYKGRGYRLHTAEASGKVVAIKVYEGVSAREQCTQAARFYQEIMHPNILHMIAVSPLESKLSFLIFDGEYEGAVDHILGQSLKKGLKESLTLGLQTVIALSSGLDYLNDLEFPFASVELDHFVLLNYKGRIVINIDPEEYKRDYRGLNVSRSTCDVFDVFHRLCQKTFDAARKAHYESDRTFNDEFDSDMEDDLPEARLREVDGGGWPLENTESNPFPGKLSRKVPPNGRRWELIWKPPAIKTTTLSEISREFQYFLNTSSSSCEPMLRSRRGRYTARTSHRCPGYNRIEIMLTTDISQSAIVSHSTPTPLEICPVCKEVVKDAEVFNCRCGGEDDENIPTVKCSSCSEWHHRPCVNISSFEMQDFVCRKCTSASGIGNERKKRNFRVAIPSTSSPMAASSSSNYRYANLHSASGHHELRSSSPPASAYFPLLSADGNDRLRPTPDAESHFAYSTTLRRHQGDGVAALPLSADFAATMARLRKTFFNIIGKPTNEYA